MAKVYTYKELLEKFFSPDNHNRDLIGLELKDMTREQFKRQKSKFNWISMDDDGEVWIYIAKPELREKEGCHFLDTEAGNPQKRIDKPNWYNPKSWQKSLERI